MIFNWYYLWGQKHNYETLFVHKKRNTIWSKQQDSWVTDLHNLFITRIGWKFYSGKLKQLIKKVGLQMRRFMTHRFLSRGTRNQQGKKGNQKYNLSLSLWVFFLIFFNPHFVVTFTPFISIFPSLISLASLLLARFFGDTCHILPWLSPIFIIKHDFWELFVLLKLFYVYLMWKRLGKEPLINVEVTTSVILILLGDFPRWSW